ncbi:hypothetical protein EJ06DRAFT_91814 [Trichodelitschia bisporula]|uniref:Altered inheritance of mitochondria protein 6 n=1 Tax=Trichodelitschia bisporula TaxID=703511 RepID=A0A6G1HSI9_9PEZI|nr:hypothetical protein EJ06DRAFT_91814 [Trichodelitschia bisporula]
MDSDLRLGGQDDEHKDFSRRSSLDDIETDGFLAKDLHSFGRDLDDEFEWSERRSHRFDIAAPRSWRRRWLSWRRPQERSEQAKVGLKRMRFCWVGIWIFIMFLALFGLYSATTLLIGLGPMLWAEPIDDFFPNWGQPGQPGEGISGYPTDFSRDVVPIPCHSHNDYWRRVPLYEAIHYGCTGVEADVWLYDGELFVGHTTASLTRNRTFRSLYTEPLERILDGQNPTTEFANASRHGVFDQDPYQTLVLLVDFKNDGDAILPVVWQQLANLRAKNYLAYSENGVRVPGPITVVATGNAPFDAVSNPIYRDIFFDAPLEMLLSPAQTQDVTLPDNAGQGMSGVDPALGGTQFTSGNSYYASINFRKSIGVVWRGQLNQKQLAKLRAQIRAAHEKGLKARYWSTPNWPIGLRNKVWRVLVREGVDYLNVDDLRGVSKGFWRGGLGGRWWW